MITFHRGLLELRDEAWETEGSVLILPKALSGLDYGHCLLDWPAFVEYLLCARPRLGTVMSS